MGGGPVVTVPDATPQGELCSDQLGRRLFNHALCTCEDTRFAGYLVTRSFSASQGSPLVAAGAPVGINDQLVSGSYVDVGGSLRVIGTTAFAGFLQVGGDLELQEDLALPGYLEVARDAWLAEDAVMTAATIGRDLLTQPGKWLPPPWVLVGGSWQQGAFSFDDPCPCGEDEMLDIAAIVADGLATNDNAEIPLDPGSLTGHVGYRRIELPCGRFYVDEISGVGDITLEVNGRTALYVGGDVSTIGRFDIEIGPDGELDLFIDGDLDQIGYGTFGDPSRPSRVRVYVSGSGDITFLGYQPVGANIYAPRARMISAGYIDMEGSLFLRELDAGAYINIAYDRDIVEEVDECEPPDEEPPSDDPPPECNDRCDALCGHQTCDESTGECTGCTTDADCCAPLICYSDGRCGPLLD
jgi:hypothetical protein